MTQQQLSEQYTNLPLEAQRQVEDFVAYLSQKYVQSSPPASSNLEDEQFIGMWRDKEETQDSTDQVRELRKAEWGEKL